MSAPSQGRAAGTASADPALAGVRSLLLDLDGCVWFGDELADGAAEFVAGARAAGLKVGFLTNTSSGTSAGLAAKLTRLGIPATEETVLMPIDALARHPLLRGEPVTFVLGRPDVFEAVAAITPVTTDPASASLLVISRDPEMTYDDLAAAGQVLVQGGAFLALNLDGRVPVTGGRIVPGTGAIAAALTATSGVTPLSVGKPSPFYFDVALERFGMERATTVMVGDNLDSDIAGGGAASLRTVHVGGSTFSALTPPPEPTLSVSDLRKLGELLGLYATDHHL